ncbi:MAG: branched-chain amino acid ABC transporter permease [Alphaproteobacteria bacterium]|nr:MAG: branched-chain amino acid ABC transporter permease [Alphaproteobacteria bacterium]
MVMRYKFEIGCVLFVALAFTITQVDINNFFFFAAFAVLQYVMIATAWNILGGYAGYINFGTAGFLGVGSYTAIGLIQWSDVSIVGQIIAAAFVSGLLGLAIGYFTLRLKGVFFAIATLALAIVLETVVNNWDFVGGAAGISILPPRNPELLGVLIVDRKGGGIFDNNKELLFFLIAFMAIFSVWVARFIEKGKLGRGLNAIKDNEEAAECMGVPTLRLKLIATTVSGSLMGAAGGIFPSYLTFIDPPTAFNLEFAINSLAMPMIGGTFTWIGPVVGALLLGTVQQVAIVTISSELNLLIIGVMLVLFVTIAPHGIVGWFMKKK